MRSTPNPAVRWSVSALVALGLLASPGCVVGSPLAAFSGVLYGMTRDDVAAIQGKRYPIWGGYPVVAMFDIPFAAVLDTGFLPIALIFAGIDLLVGDEEEDGLGHSHGEGEDHDDQGDDEGEDHDHNAPPTTRDRDRGEGASDDDVAREREATAREREATRRERERLEQEREAERLRREREQLEDERRRIEAEREALRREREAPKAPPSGEPPSGEAPKAPPTGEAAPAPR